MWPPASHHSLPPASRCNQLPVCPPTAPARPAWMGTGALSIPHKCSPPAQQPRSNGLQLRTLSGSQRTTPSKCSPHKGQEQTATGDGVFTEHRTVSPNTLSKHQGSVQHHGAGSHRPSHKALSPSPGRRRDYISPFSPVCTAQSAQNLPARILLGRRRKADAQEPSPGV